MGLAPINKIQPWVMTQGWEVKLKTHHNVEVLGLTLLKNQNREMSFSYERVILQTHISAPLRDVEYLSSAHEGVIDP